MKKSLTETFTKTFTVEGWTIHSKSRHEWVVRQKTSGLNYNEIDLQFANAESATRFASILNGELKTLLEKSVKDMIRDFKK